MACCILPASCNKLVNFIKYNMSVEMGLVVTWHTICRLVNVNLDLHLYNIFQLTGNLLAVGTMEPFINIWDLDVIDAIDPVLKLGDKKKKKHKKVKTTCHLSV